MARRIKEKQLDLTLSGSFTGSFFGNSIGTFSGSFIGDGSELVSIPATSIVGLQLFQISSGSISASVDNSSADIFKLNDEIDDIFIIKNTGVVVVKEQQTEPGIITGGIMYSGSNFWLGIE